MMTTARSIIGLALSLALGVTVSSAYPEGFRTLEPAVLYSGPSERVAPLLIFEKGYPLRRISEIDEWHKVETSDQKVGWIKSEILESASLAVVMEDDSTVRRRPDANADVMFAAVSGVILEIVEDSPGDWLLVRHRDGESGYILKSSVWRNHRESP